MRSTRITRNHSGRRGLSLVEVLVAAGIMLSVMLALTSLSRIHAMQWQGGLSYTSGQVAAQRAINGMARDLRAARSVVLGSSTANRLTIQLPAYTSGGSLVIPPQDGHLVSYYRSDSTGSTSRTGNILWRAVDGTPDTAWSLQTGTTRGRTVLDSGIAQPLAFTYFPTADPESVVVALYVQGSQGTKTTQFATTQEVMLHNKGMN